MLETAVAADCDGLLHSRTCTLLRTPVLTTPGFFDGLMRRWAFSHFPTLHAELFAKHPSYSISPEIYRKGRHRRGIRALHAPARDT
jgi:hypothetical protein